MKRLNLIIFCFLLFSLFSCTKKLEFISKYKDGKLKIKYAYILQNEEKLKHGKYEEYYSNGTLKQYSEYEEGSLQGKSKTFYNNSNIKTLKTYKNGELLKSIGYFKDGRIQEPYLKEILGKWQWDLFGISARYVFRENGKGSIQMEGAGDDGADDINWIIKYRGETKYLYIYPKVGGSSRQVYRISKITRDQIKTDKIVFKRLK